MVSKRGAVVPGAGEVVEVVVHLRVNSFRNNDGAPCSSLSNVGFGKGVEVAHQRRVLSGGLGDSLDSTKDKGAERAVDLSAGVYHTCPLGAILPELRLVLFEEVEEGRKGKVAAVIEEVDLIVKSEVAAFESKVVVRLLGRVVVLRGLVIDVEEVGAVTGSNVVIVEGEDLVLANERLNELPFGDRWDSLGDAATLTAADSASAVQVTQIGITKSEGVIVAVPRGVALHAVRPGAIFPVHFLFPVALSFRIARRVSNSAISAAVVGSTSASISFSSVVS